MRDHTEPHTEHTEHTAGRRAGSTRTAGRGPSTHRRRAGAAAAAALAIAGAAAAATSSSAATPAPPAPTRASVVASGEDAHAVDALAAGPLASVLGTGVLLTAADALPAATADQLRERDPGLVYVVGGAGAVSEQVVDQIDALLGADTVVRLDGSDRWATAARVTAATEGFVEAPLE
ncbi:cell wall-binding repeat-containing protein [Paenibacillus sp. TRM 82003]|uniref:cell wall-binding repeat-containing protein n=1 Tax=Kineococcus sp. TRM81007 TaxID=2925831 RepID=UPI001F56C876|nr:cell wall-binding repeat-containing protein [Kineococcus sp. TRM81007]MCI2239961.1 cell wall-binding repeat-containing protein [Kineococcus sp. TRM81007]MCI3925734.1 cell wall-binding repeat-containing protein [Paenibacillus sp. TRM 82003]